MDILSIAAELLPRDIEARIYFVLIFVITALTVGFMVAFRRASNRADRTERVARDQARHIRWLTGPAGSPRNQVSTGRKPR